ncbi:MAG: hypothetical protein WCO25_06015 [Candidatus Uhrbacteria bacterium]
MAQSDAGMLAGENMLAAIRKNRISPQAVEGILKGHAVFGPLGEAFLRGEIGTDRLSALLTPTVARPRPAKKAPVVCPAIPLTPDQERVKAFLGDAFVSPEKYAKAFHLPGIGDADLAKLAVIPWSNEELLEEINLGAVLYPHVEGVTLPSLRKTFGASQRRQPCFYKDNDWWKDDLHEGLRDHTLPTGWRLVRNGEEPNSTSITWDAQLALVPETHDRTWVLEIAEMAMLSYRLWKLRPLQNKYAWCQDLDGDGFRSLAGFFVPSGLTLHGFRPSHSWRDNALVLSRKPSQPLALGPSA